MASAATPGSDAALRTSPDTVNAIERSESASAFDDAMCAGDAAEVRRLAVGGQDVNALTEDGSTPLYIAASQGCRDVCLALIEAGADVRAVDEHGETALHAASEEGHRDVCVALLEQGPTCMQ